eukprot:3497087-Amphidinium_carterae.1
MIHLPPYQHIEPGKPLLAGSLAIPVAKRKNMDSSSSEARTINASMVTGTAWAKTHQPNLPAHTSCKHATPNFASAPNFPLPAANARGQISLLLMWQSPRDACTS